MQRVLRDLRVGIAFVYAVSAVLLLYAPSVSSSIENPTSKVPEVAHYQVFEDEHSPIVAAQPEYPARAVKRGIEGFVTLEFTLTEKGTVKDPVVIESNPPGIFDRSAIQALLKFEYQPKVVDGKPTQVEGVKHKIVYELEDATGDGEYLPIRKVRAEYPPRAISRGIEGSVTMEFTVTENGTVKDPVVVDSNPPGIFDRSAIQALLKFKYRPKVVDGKPTQVEGVKHKIVFELEE